MAIVSVAPQLVASNPSVLNTGAELFVSVPLTNVGGSGATNVSLTGFTVGPAPRLSPQVFPVFVGNIAVGSSGAINGRFNSRPFIAGQRLLLTLRGSYGPTGAKAGFSVNRYVVVPPPGPYPVPLLKAHVVASVQPTLWSYTIVNDEPAGSPQCLAGFSLSIAAPVSVTGTPPGWSFETDNATYVYWFSTDESLPYPNHARPGTSLPGFQIQNSTLRSESTPYLLTSWRQDTNEAGLVAADLVVTPGRAG